MSTTTAAQALFTESVRKAALVESCLDCGAKFPNQVLVSPTNAFLCPACANQHRGIEGHRVKEIAHSRFNRLEAKHLSDGSIQKLAKNTWYSSNKGFSEKYRKITPSSSIDDRKAWINEIYVGKRYYSEEDEKYSQAVSSSALQQPVYSFSQDADNLSKLKPDQPQFRSTPLNQLSAPQVGSNASTEKQQKQQIPTLDDLLDFGSVITSVPVVTPNPIDLSPMLNPSMTSSPAVPPALPQNARVAALAASSAPVSSPVLSNPSFYPMPPGYSSMQAMQYPVATRSTSATGLPTSPQMGSSHLAFQQQQQQQQFQSYPMMTPQVYYPPQQYQQYQQMPSQVYYPPQQPISYQHHPVIAQQQQLHQRSMSLPLTPPFSSAPVVAQSGQASPMSQPASVLASLPANPFMQSFSPPMQPAKFLSAVDSAKQQPPQLGRSLSAIPVSTLPSSTAPSSLAPGSVWNWVQAPPISSPSNSLQASSKVPAPPVAAAAAQSSAAVPSLSGPPSVPPPPPPPPPPSQSAKVADKSPNPISTPAVAINPFASASSPSSSASSVMGLKPVARSPTSVETPVVESRNFNPARPFQRESQLASSASFSAPPKQSPPPPPPRNLFRGSSMPIGGSSASAKVGAPPPSIPSPEEMMEALRISRLRRQQSQSSTSFGGSGTSPINSNDDKKLAIGLDSGFEASKISAHPTPEIEAPSLENQSKMKELQKKDESLLSLHFRPFRSASFGRPAAGSSNPNWENFDEKK